MMTNLNTKRNQINIQEGITPMRRNKTQNMNVRIYINNSELTTKLCL